MKTPPFVVTKPIVFTVTKNGTERTVTVPAERAEQTMPEPFPFHFALMAGGGGQIRIIRQ